MAIVVNAETIRICKKVQNKPFCKKSNAAIQEILQFERSKKLPLL